MRIKKLEVLLESYEIDRRSIYEKLSLALNNPAYFDFGVSELDDEISSLSELENKIKTLDAIISSIETRKARAMTILLKSILFLLMLGIGLLGWQFFKDWKLTKSAETYLTSTTPWEKIKFNSIFFATFFSMSIVELLLIWLIISSIKITPIF